MPQCSETPPTCSACARLGFACEWKDVSMFRRQEAWAEQMVARRVNQTKRLRGDVEAKATVALTSIRLPSNQVNLDMEACAVHRFYREYAYTAGTAPFLYLVAPLAEQSSTPACLKSALHAVSLATTAKQLKRHEMMLRAKQYYGLALEDHAAALGQPEVARHDGVVLALSLLGLYEVSKGLRPNFVTGASLNSFLS